MFAKNTDELLEIHLKYLEHKSYSLLEQLTRLVVFIWMRYFCQKAAKKFALVKAEVMLGKFSIKKKKKLLGACAYIYNHPFNTDTRQWYFVTLFDTNLKNIPWSQTSGEDFQAATLWVHRVQHIQWQPVPTFKEWV